MIFLKISNFADNGLLVNPRSDVGCGCANIRVDTSNKSAMEACEQAQIESTGLPSVISA